SPSTDGLSLEGALAEYLGMIAIKTDPVLSPTGELAGLSLNFMPSPEKDGVTIHISQKNLIEGFSVNILAAFQMASLLEKSGRKVSMKVNQVNGVSHLIISVDGKQLEPIVFEYKPGAN